MAKEKKSRKDLIKELLTQSKKVDKALGKYSSTLDNNCYCNIDEYIDTGSFMLNRLITGSIYKGIPRGRVYGFAGESGVGKSFLCGQLIRRAQEEDYLVLVYDSENAISSDFLERIGCKTDEILYFPVDGIEQFRNHVINTLQPILEENPEQKVLIVLDSYGNLSCAKEMNDIEQKKDAADMGQRAKAGGQMFRAITKFCGKYGVTMVYTNHVYKDTASATNPMYAKNKQSGGNKATYMSTGVIFLGKSAEKDSDKNVTGNFLRAKSEKNRLVPEGKMVEMYLSFKNGPNRYYGLMEQAVEAGVAKQGSNSKNFIVPHVSDKQIHIAKIYSERRDEVFTKEFLDKIDEYCMNNYKYSSINDEDTYINNLPESEEDEE